MNEYLIKNKNNSKIKTGETLGIIGFVLAIIAILFSFIPCFMGIGTVFLNSVSIGLCIAGIVISRKYNQGKKITLAIVGLILSFLTIVIKIVVLVAIAVFVNNPDFLLNKIL